MLRIYGSMLCGDCVNCRADLDRAEVAYEFLDIGQDLENLKEFLAIRDREAIFAPVKDEIRVGIPLILCDDGNYTFDWSGYVSQGNA